LPRDEAHLLDILKAARLAVEFKGAGEKAEFLADAKTQSAVLHQLLIIGEQSRDYRRSSGRRTRKCLGG
jgi:uncharacterized protein with HEPN domain